MWATFYNVLFPITLIAGLGFLLDKRFQLETKSLSRIVVYLASPALVFSSVSRSTLAAEELWQLLAFTVLMMLIMAAVSGVAAKVLRLNRKTASAFTLSGTLINAGNFGLPFIAFAFGDAGLGRAVIIYTGTSIVANTLGVFLASRGSASMWKSLQNVLTVPLPYALLAGLLVNFRVISLPLPLEKSFALLGNAAVPVMLVILGAQLARVQLGKQLPLVSFAGGIKLLLAPVIGVALVRVLLLHGMTASIAIIQTSMPTAVISIVLAEEFGSDARFVSSAVVVSTAFSLFSLSILLQLFGG